ncbi:unnamed protein product [Trichobilharzia regenti]|nr:unnamed protein product [Trichobilharzia regenti]
MPNILVDADSKPSPPSLNTSGVIPSGPTASQRIIRTCVRNFCIHFSLVRWLEYSKRNTCELCNHQFTFTRIYASGTPRFLPPTVLICGLANSLRRFLLNWIHLSIVFTAWLVVVPLSACRMYRCLFTGSVFSLLTLPLDMVSTKHLLQDCIQFKIIHNGASVVAYHHRVSELHIPTLTFINCVVSQNIVTYSQPLLYRVLHRFITDRQYQSRLTYLLF